MARSFKLRELDEVLETFDYPLNKTKAMQAGDDITITLADGDIAFSNAIEPSTAKTFESAEDLKSEIMSNLPREAVGEPYQSEGDA